MASRDLSPSTETPSGSLPANAPTSGVAETVSGYITPRRSWPRPATPTDLTPNWAGEFNNFEDWVNFATTRLTGTVDPMMGGEVKSICIDALGRRCTMGGHFMRARDEGAFPVRYFWDCAPLGNTDAVTRRAQPEGAAQGPTGDEMNPESSRSLDQ